MSVPFQPGDVVAYIGKSKFLGRSDSNLQIGSIHRILDVAHEKHWPGPAVWIAARDWWVYADCFRKIDDEVTEDFREQLRTLRKPTPQPVDFDTPEWWSDRECGWS